MVLIRQLTLRSLQYNVRNFARHIFGKMNILPDLLSRGKMEAFHRHRKALQMNKEETTPATELWPLSSFWREYCDKIC